MDEHYSPQIAEQLRTRGHDVAAVIERADLEGRSDRDLISTLQAERRAVVTENVADFMPIVHELASRADDHWGFVFTSPRSMPRDASTIGLYVDALAALLRARPGDDDLKNQVIWLQRPNT